MDEVRHNAGAESFTLRTGITASDLDHLGAVPLFAGFEKQDLQTLLAASSMRRYPDQTILFMEGDPAERFFVVMSGWVKLFRLREDGHEVVISVIAPGESFAEAAIFGSRDYPVSAQSISDTRLLVLNGDSVREELRRNTEFVFNILGSLSRHMRNNISLLHRLSAMSATERLAQFLLGHSNVTEGQATITLPLDKALIAAHLGMQPETFSRALAKLKGSGVASTGHMVTIDDVAVLRRHIKGDFQSCC